MTYHIVLVLGGTIFCGLSFQGCLYSEQHQKNKCLPMEQRADLFTDQYNKENFSLEAKIRQVCLQLTIKDRGSLNLGFSAVMQICVCSIHLDCSVGLGSRGNDMNAKFMLSSML